MGVIIPEQLLLGIVLWLMLVVLSGMVLAYNVLGDPEALPAIRQTIAFIQAHMLQEGRLLSVYKDGQAKFLVIEFEVRRVDATPPKIPSPPEPVKSGVEVER